MNAFRTPKGNSVAAAPVFVLFALGAKRFALPAEIVTELAQLDRVYGFPHTTPLLTGVLLRRGKIVPVCDVALVLIGAGGPVRRFYLIAECGPAGNAIEWAALPVNGECELCQSPMVPPAGTLPHYVKGLLSLPDEIVEVLDLEQLISTEMRA